MIKRIFLPIALGVTATSGLFYLMQYLIADETTHFEETEYRVFNIAPEIEEAEINSRPDKPEPPPVVEEQPERLVLAVLDDTNIIGENWHQQVVSIDRKPRASSSTFTDGEYLPIAKVQPVYPSRAVSRGIEGHVLLEFTVTRTGSVVDPVVLESVPKGVFDRAAKNAALKFKYKPRVVQGSPVAVSGVTNLIRFNLDS